MTTNNEILDALNASLLYASAVTSAEQSLAHTSATSPYRAGRLAELDALKARWDAEAPARQIRETARRAGFTKSKHGNGWVRREGGRWVTYTSEQVAEELA